MAGPIPASEDRPLLAFRHDHVAVGDDDETTQSGGGPPLLCDPLTAQQHETSFSTPHMRVPSGSFPAARDVAGTDEKVCCFINGLLSVHVPLGGEVTDDAELRINGEGSALYVHIVATCGRRALSSALARCSAEAAGAFRVTATFIPPPGHTAAASPSDVLIGYLSAKQQHVSVREFLPFAPEGLRLRSEYVEEAGDAMEERFCASLESMFLSPLVNPFRSSLASAYAQNHAKLLPLYDAVVVKRYYTSWHQFLRAHPKQFSMFQVSDSDVAAHKLDPFVKPNEVRVSLVGVHTLQQDASCAGEQRRHDESIIQFLQRLLKRSAGGVDQREVMEQLSGHPAFVHSLRPSLSTLSRFLLAHSHLYTWPPNTVAADTVGLRRPGRAEPSSQSLFRLRIPSQGSAAQGTSGQGRGKGGGGGGRGADQRRGGQRRRKRDSKGTD
eukprot:TRINITY_DN8868_c1_g5_i1.p1 TRINITY_DN8868_c1_g5~~TRINITY_DN8868_c1_g5_i1.p1  ORF type:complete len:440 (+),score=98.68 TRINITY_DN8868_c1_g5_i1:360-1679(+)